MQGNIGIYVHNAAAGEDFALQEARSVHGMKKGHAALSESMSFHLYETLVTGKLFCRIHGSYYSWH